MTENTRLAKCIEEFKAVLKTRSAPEIKAKWKNNENPIYKQASLEDCIAIFRVSLYRRNIFIIKEIWDKNELLQAWFSKLKPNQPAEEHINCFRTALNSRCLYIINKIWNSSLTLRKCFSGQKIDIEKIEKLELLQILKEYIRNFELLLSTRRMKCIQMIWNEYPKWLKSYFAGNIVSIKSGKKLQFEKKETEALIEKILNLSLLGPRFVVLYLSLVKDIKLLKKFLNSSDKSLTRAKAKERLLFVRIEEIAKEKD
jgi:hypothetical protein